MNAGRAAWAAVAIVIAAASVLGALRWRRAAQEDESVRQRVSERVAASDSTRVSCDVFKAGDPLVLLVLGQSNAANRGTASGADRGAPVNIVSDRGTCHRTSDPLPGATGRNASVWSRLPAALAAAGIHRPVVFGLLAVEATSIHEWTSRDSPLPGLLDGLSRQMIAVGLPPALVLWQQGEADAIVGTPPSEYVRGLQELAVHLHAAGVKAPLLLAQSTVCRSAPVPALSAAVKGLVAADPRFELGPDIDGEVGPAQRIDGCHLNGAGLDAAAALWARAVARGLH